MYLYLGWVSSYPLQLILTEFEVEMISHLSHDFFFKFSFLFIILCFKILLFTIPQFTSIPLYLIFAKALPRLTDREKVVEIMDPALEGQYSMKEVIQVAAIATMCVQPEADYRPLMADVVQSLVPLMKTHRSTSKVGSCSSFDVKSPTPTAHDISKISL